MKWIVAELVEEPGVQFENDEGEMVPYVHWVRLEQEFTDAQAARDWLAQQPNADKLELRRLDDGVAEGEA